MGSQDGASSCSPAGGAGSMVGSATVPEPAQPERVLLSLIEGWQQLAAIVEGSDTAIIGKSLDGTIRTWNPGAERLYGYGAAEVIGRPISMLAPADRRDEIPEILDRVARGERVERLETVRRARDGRLVEVSLSVSPIRDLSGRITGASTIAHDISPRRRAVALERANEAMRMFVATASHDLRTPLATALGFAELLQQQGAELSGQDRAECLGAVLRSIRQATRLVEDLLTLSKIQAGRVEVRPDRVVLRPAIAA